MEAVRPTFNKDENSQGHKEDVLFTVQGNVTLRLEFELQPSRYWNLTNMTVSELNLAKGSLLKEVSTHIRPHLVFPRAADAFRT